MTALSAKCLLGTLLLHTCIAWDSDCENVVFDHTDNDVHVRTMVIEDQMQQRSLVLLNDADKSEPCKLQWWLDHNPQGVVKCLGEKANQTGLHPSNMCDASTCQADVDNVQLGYVRTMLASAVYEPLPHAMSAICIELGCRSRIRRVKLAGTLLETAPQVSWGHRPRPSKILVVGLGSSTMALWLRKKLPDTTLHVAELVPSVVAAAPCFGLDDKNDPNLHLHVTDGRAFLNNSPDGEYDVIIIDAFDTTASLPPCFRTKEFFEIARRKLSPGGALSFNLLNNHASKRVLEGLASQFDQSHLWVGDAPGAIGIQNVITAFAPGRASGAQPHASDDAETKHSVEAWFNSAAYRPVPATALKSLEPFEDSTECPASK